MEFHPILEQGNKPNEKLWYVISAPEPPSVRVGQACVYCERDVENEQRNEFYVLAGADPSKTFNDIYRLDLHQFKWNKITSPQFEERYEHCAFVSEHDRNIYVFGGANKANNLNSTQVFNSDTELCSTINSMGKLPTPRTIHSAASSGNNLYVWGGGSSGSTPVPDLQLHVFDAVSKNWSQPIVKGKLPSARHGHVSVVCGKNLYVHGGMSGSTFHKDFHSIDLKTFSCQKLKPRGDVPSGRAAHSATTYNKVIFVFGGMCEQGALDDMLQYNTDTNSWLKLKFESPPPTPRLDHSLIIAHLPCRKEQVQSIQCANSDEEKDNEQTPPQATKPNAADNVTPTIIPVDIWSGSADIVDKVGKQVHQNLNLSENTSAENGDNSSKNPKPKNPTSSVVNNVRKDNTQLEYVPVCVVFGGMDTSGNIFNDLLVLRVG